jgi:hypothetical protein
MNTQHEHSFLPQLPHFADMTHVTHYRSPDPMPIPAVAPSQGSELRLWRRNVPAIVRRSDSCRNLANAIIAASKVRRSWFQRHPPAGQGRSHYHADQVHPCSAYFWKPSRSDKSPPRHYEWRGVFNWQLGTPVTVPCASPAAGSLLSRACELPPPAP